MCKSKPLPDFKTRELPASTLFLDEEKIICLKTRIAEGADVGDCDTGSVDFPSSHSREARVEHTCEVMTLWGAGAIQSLP
jgi:hypothetical protein